LKYQSDEIARPPLPAAVDCPGIGRPLSTITNKNDAPKRQCTLLKTAATRCLSWNDSGNF
jgi:hypothetical protein